MPPWQRCTIPLLVDKSSQASEIAKSLFWLLCEEARHLSCAKMTARCCVTASQLGMYIFFLSLRVELLSTQLWRGRKSDGLTSRWQTMCTDVDVNTAARKLHKDTHLGKNMTPSGKQFLTVTWWSHMYRHWPLARSTKVDPNQANTPFTEPTQE